MVANGGFRSGMASWPRGPKGNGSAPDSDSAGSNTPAPTVLVIEDDDMVSDALVDIITDEGYRVATARNGREALDKLRWGLQPAVILLDMQMPLMTGWDFRAEQKRDPTLGHIPVIAMTAGRRWKEEDADCDARLTKPVSRDTLVELLRRYCGEERLRSR